MTRNQQSILWGAAGALIFLVTVSDFIVGTRFFARTRLDGSLDLADIGFGLCTGIFMMGMAWLRAGGKVFHAYQRPRRK